MHDIQIVLPVVAGGEQTKPLLVSINASAYSPIYEIKRRIESATGIAPVIQRLRTASNGAMTDDLVHVPQVLQLHKRNRNASQSVIIKPFLGDEIVIAVDTSDTILDVRFLLSPITGLPAESHVMSARGADMKAGVLPDTLLVVSIPLPIRLWYEIKQSESDRGNVHRCLPVTISCAQPNLQTLQQCVRSSLQIYAKRNLFGTRSWLSNGLRGDYEWMSFEQINDRITKLGAGLYHLGLRKGDKIGIMSLNRTEWALTDFTCMCFGFVSVTLYDTLGPSVIEYIINHAEIRAVVVERAKLTQIASIRCKCPRLDFVIGMDDQTPDREFFCNNSGGRTHLLSELENLGSLHPRSDTAITSSDLASICYTSGTTGNPKGAMLTHKNLVSAMTALNLHVRDLPQLEDESTISYLPLAHIYERLAHISSVSRGVSIGYYQGDTTKLLDDVSLLRPGYFPGVPRVWQRIYDRVQSQVNESGFIKKKLFEYAFDAKLKAIKAGDTSLSIWDTLVFSKIADKFGGRLRIMFSGSAPISSKIATFMKICFQSNFTEGYGLTETCASATVAPIEDCDYGHVGVPTGCCEIMLVDVPTMNYLHSDTPCPRGEVWIRGHNVFVGYYKEPSKTAECMSKDGWFMTGDIGCWRPDGRLEIIDRMKNIFKLSQGEYIRPEYIENVYKSSPFVANIFVHGDSLQRYLVAIVVPDFEVISQWAMKHMPDVDQDHANLIKHPRVHRLVHDEMTRVGKSEGLRGFEFVRRFVMIREDFTIENDLLTPSMKLKRHHAKMRFKNLIDALYTESKL